MVYRQYLFLCILRDNNPYFESMPYDDQFFKGSTLWRSYSNSKWDNFNKGDYECMEDFMKDNQELINTTIKEERNG